MPAEKKAPRTAGVSIQTMSVCGTRHLPFVFVDIFFQLLNLKIIQTYRKVASTAQRTPTGPLPYVEIYRVLTFALSFHTRAHLSDDFGATFSQSSFPRELNYCHPYYLSESLPRARTSSSRTTTKHHVQENNIIHY